MRTLLCALLFVSLAGGVADARKKQRPKRRGAPAPAEVERGASATTEEPASEVKQDSKKKVKVFDFTGIGIEGTMRSPQLLYFLNRAREELQRASLQKRSFMTELYRSVEEGGL